MVVFLAVFLSLSAVAETATRAIITGRVTDLQGTPLPDATVTLVELRRSVRTGADGTYRFEGVPQGHYHVRAESLRSGEAIGEADVIPGMTRTVDIIVDAGVHAEEIVVTASADSRSASEVYQPIEVVDEEELAAVLQPTLGETLNNEPGVNSTYFGPGSSRPIIRGLGADRIRVLEEGIGSGDASNVSPDHAVSLDPANAEQIEIVRGPATLLYGSNAVGGVVNVIDNRVPNRVPTQPVTGNVDLRLGTVADERNGSLSLLGGADRWAWHTSLSLRDSGDYETPLGTLANTSLESQAGSAGVSHVSSRGFLGIAYSGFTTNYGVPGEDVRIDMDQRRFDLKGELTNLTHFRAIRLRIGKSDYEHVELEGDEIGTRFTNDGFEGRLDATHDPIGSLTGSFGVQWTHNDLVAEGEEAFIPPNETDARAIFAFEELTRGRWDVQFGGRYESQDVRVDDDTLDDRSFAGVSTSVGAIFRPVDGYAIAGAIARAVRIPTATELFANGPHAATAQFEVGNPGLDEETTIGVDVSFRKTAGRVQGEINFFQNRFDGFIFEAPTGEIEDDLPVFRFEQVDATFRGFEIDGHTELWHAGESHLELEIGADAVQARLDRDDNRNLPRIPPARLSLGLRYRGGPVTASAEVRRYAEQDDVAENETPTDGYTLVNATVSYRFFVRNTVHDVLLRATNLTDELARVHTSPLKDVAPLPGRDFAVSYRVSF